MYKLLEKKWQNVQTVENNDQYENETQTLSINRDKCSLL